MNLSNVTHKIYILSVAASGKSTFAEKFPHYMNCQVIDVYNLLPQATGLLKAFLYLCRVFAFLKPLAKNTKPQLAKTSAQYHSIITNYLMAQEESTIVLGNRGPEDLKQYNGIKIAAVIIPEDQHRKNCLHRKHQLRNPLPFFHHQSTNFNNVEKMRESLSNYAIKHQIPIFESFEDAITTLINI